MRRSCRPRVSPLEEAERGLAASYTTKTDTHTTSMKPMLLTFSALALAGATFALAFQGGARRAAHTDGDSCPPGCCEPGCCMAGADEPGCCEPAPASETAATAPAALAPAGECCGGACPPACCAPDGA